MKPQFRTVVNHLTFALMFVSFASPRPFPVAGDEPAAAKVNATITLEEALQQLRLYPKDAYLQYVVLQLARRENRVEEIASQVDGILGNEEWNRRAGRRDQVDLFSIFTGALAVQESLQLDTMRGARGIRRPAAQEESSPAQQEAAQAALEKRRLEIVDVASLTGPTIKSHPWEAMLAGRKPDVGPLARKVPEDFFFAEFGSLTKMLDVLDSGELWTKHLFHQTAGEARSQQVGDRLKRQLVVDTNPLVRPFYDLVVEEVAMTGSDLFFNEGSDLTLLFRFKQPAVFKARMDGFLQAAERTDKKVERTAGKYNGIDYVHLRNADRTVHVYSAYPEANLHVRSNSLPALERVLAAIQGKGADGQPVRRLGDSSEFAYIRTLMPRGAKLEDGFLYLSDPFIRKLVGPSLKLTERRRVLCYNQLRMIGHASLMHRGEFGRLPDSLETLEKSKCSPGLFGTEKLACPDGGKYSLSADGTTGVCSHHGPSHDLVPCIEHPVSKVTGEEADEYSAFLVAYNAYWRTLFDPIGIRVKISDEQYRLETIILPLIDSSIYKGLATALGGVPEPLDGLPVPARNIFSINFRFDKKRLAEGGGLTEPDASPKDVKRAGNELAHDKSLRRLEQIGGALNKYHDNWHKASSDGPDISPDTSEVVRNSFEKCLPPQALCDSKDKPLLSWRVMLLPFLGHQQLFQEFHLDEKWDSEHNKKLVGRMPAVFQSPSPKANFAGKTTYLAPVGKNLMFTGGPKGIRFDDVTDGLFATILIVESDEEHAVTWTQPQDLTIDPKMPGSGLVDYPSQGSPVLFVDGSVGIIPKKMDEKALRALFTRNGKEPVPSAVMDTLQQQRHEQFAEIPGVDGEISEKLGLPRLLFKGIGNQAGLHVYDSPPTLDFSLPVFLGTVLGRLNARDQIGGGALGGGELGYSFLVASLNAPVYLSVPVQDAGIVDDFLNELDGILASYAREEQFGIRFDFYRFGTANVPVIRCQSLGFGPVKLRLFWARIGTGFYVASKSFILDDLAAAAKAQAAGHAKGPTGHAMFRIRSKNWNQVLPDFRLGWAENNRRACLDNLGPLASVARAVPGTGTSDAVCRCADRLYGAHFFCPEGGRYERAPDGKAMTCSVHGSALAPRQAVAPAQNQALGKLIGGFAGLEATLTFLEDGLHAVVTIDRK